MLRPLEATTSPEPAAKTVGVGVRSDGGAGERASADTLEQSAIAVRQAAVVALGSGARAATESATTPPLYSRPPPVHAATAAPSPSTERVDVATGSANGQGAAQKASAEASSAPRYTRGANGVYYAKASGQVAVDTTPIKGDPEATLQKLMQVREAALAPPTSPDDLQMAQRMALDIQRAQLELARERYSSDVQPPAAPNASDARHAATDVKA
jgi:hypothetical protein